MVKFMSIVSIVIVNAFLQITCASPQNAYASSNGANPNGNSAYYNSQQTQISNFGNGYNKHNIINVDENSNTVSVRGSSYGTNLHGRPSIHNVNVDVPAQPRTPLIHNVGNGVGNSNVFVLNDNRDTPRRPNYNQRRIQSRFSPGDDSFREPANPGDLLLHANIGTGYNNDNRLYVDGQRIDLYPNNAGQGINLNLHPNNYGSGIETTNVRNDNVQNKDAGFNRQNNPQNKDAGFNRQNNPQNGNTAGNFNSNAGSPSNQDDIRSAIDETLGYANNYGNGAENKNIIKIENVQPTPTPIDRLNRQNNYQKGKAAVDKLSPREIRSVKSIIKFG